MLRKYIKNFSPKKIFRSKIFFSAKIYFSSFGFVILIGPLFHPQNDIPWRRPCETRFLAVRMLNILYNLYHRIQKSISSQITTLFIIASVINSDALWVSELYIGGTTSTCIFESDEDQIGLHSKNQKGPHGNAFFETKGTTSEWSRILLN